MYGYSSSDPRYVNATLTQVLEDLVEIKAVEYISVFESHDSETNEYLKASTKNPKLIAADQRQMEQDVKELLGLLHERKQSSPS